MVSIILWLYLLILPVLANYGFDQWSNSDLKQFLKERKVSFNENLENPKLISLANQEAKKLEKEYQKFIKQNHGQHQDSEFLNFNYLFGNKDHEKYSIKEWIFESWPVTNLQNLLSRNGISFNKEDTRQDLIEKIKQEFDKIAETNQGSKFYPGNWLYESSWSDDDLKKWLTDYGIDFEPQSTREELIDKLKELSYQATNSIKDTKESLFNSLDLFDKSIFDKYGQIKDEFFETWNYSQLREWLYLHGFIDTKPGVYVEELNKDELIKLAQTYKKYMLSDIQTWLADTEKDYQPWITKGEQRKNKADEWINDTFFVGINNWSKDKLREFLDVRKVSYSIFTTKHQLIELVKKHKFDPIHVETYAWVVDDVSTDSIKQWLKDQGQQIEGSRQDLVSAFQKQFEGLKNGASNLYNNIELQIRFYTPDINGYKHYLEKNLDPKEYEKLTEDQIQKGFEVVQEYYKLGSDAAKENFDKAKFSAADALDQIEESSYAYSLEFLRGAEKGKNNIAAFIKDAHISSKNYVNSLTQKLSQNIDELQSGALDRLTRWWYGAQATYDNRVDAANQVVLDVSDEVKNYQEKAGEQYESLKSQASKKGLSIASDAKDGYDSIESQISDQYDEAAADVQAKYDKAQEHVSKLAADVNSRASEAQKGFDKGYVKYKTFFGEYAEGIYRKALYGLSLFNNKVYKTAKKTEKGINSQWDNVVRAFSNADLKAYLRSFGYNYDWLSRLNRRELVNLAAFQNRLFTGYDNVKSWERSVGDVLSDAGEDLQVKLGLKSKPQGFVAKLRSYIGL